MTGYKILQVEQGSSAWLELRKNKISGTDAAKILNLNPWSSSLALWEEKLSLREPQKMNASMQRGIDLEPIARSQFNAEIMSHFEPIVLEHADNSWAMASLDGMNSKGQILEIKCNGEKNHSLALQGIIPDYYLAQIQHCLWVSGAEVAYYYSYTPESQKIIEVIPDLEFIEKMIEAEKEFYKMMMEFISPPTTDKDYEVSEDKDLIFRLEVLHKLKQQVKDISTQISDLEDSIVLICNGRSTKAANFKITKCTRRGSIDYSSIDILKNVKLDDYRKSPTTYYRISENKNE